MPSERDEILETEMREQMTDAGADEDSVSAAIEVKYDEGPFHADARP